MDLNTVGWIVLVVYFVGLFFFYVVVSWPDKNGVLPDKDDIDTIVYVLWPIVVWVIFVIFVFDKTVLAAKRKLDDWIKKKADKKRSRLLESKEKTETPINQGE